MEEARTVSVFEDDGVFLDVSPDELVLNVAYRIVRVGPHEPERPARRVHDTGLIHLATRG